MLAGFLFAEGDRQPALAEELASPSRFYLEGGGAGETSFSLQVGDTIFTNEASYYVESVTGRKANLWKIQPQEAELWAQLPLGAAQIQDQEEDRGFRGIAVILHTHSMESYGIPEGERGTIYGVGKAISDALAARGIKTIHSWAVYSPADAGAYVRARRTLTALERYHPDLVLDVHREECAPELKKASRGIRLVVGRNHPHFRENLAFALKVQKKAEQTPAYQGLVREVLVVRGVYNQDLKPRSLLVMVGNKDTPREEAIQAGAKFGELLADTLYPMGKAVLLPEERKEKTEETKWKKALMLVGGFTLLLLVYRYLAIRASSGKDKGNRR